MKVLEARRAPARPSAQKPTVYKTATIPAPTLGLIANANIASPPPGGAEQLENFLSTATGAILRRGCAQHGSLGVSDPVRSLFAYANGNNRKMFATTDDAIFNVTSPTLSYNLVDNLGNSMTTDTGDHLVLFSEEAIIPDVTGLTGGDWVSTQFATSGGVYLRLVNGFDVPRVYDGAAWSTTPTITGTDPTRFSYLWPYKQRLFFVEKDSLNAWYLPADSIGGAAVLLPLGSIFTRGGSLLFGSSWSLETGTGGLSEQCIFVSTEGEVAVFQGSDPASASTWSRVGVYRIGKPLGKNAHFRAGGDIVICTDIGAIPLSQALQKDFAVLSPSAVSAQIETIWNTEVRNRPTLDWKSLVWSSNQMAVVAPPVTSGQPTVLYVVNTRTGGWSKFTGWDVRCLLVFNDRLFYGSDNGIVVEANVTGQDMGVPYVGVYTPLFSDLGAPGRKVASMTRVVTKSVFDPKEKLSMQKDYRVVLPAPPAANAVSLGNVWGAGIWGVSRWGGAQVKTSFGTWKSTPQNGDVLSPALQITSGNISPLDTEIVRTDVTYQLAEMVV